MRVEGELGKKGDACNSIFVCEQAMNSEEGRITDTSIVGGRTQDVKINERIQFSSSLVVVRTRKVLRTIPLLFFLEIATIEFNENVV